MHVSLSAHGASEGGMGGILPEWPELAFTEDGLII